MGNLSAVAPKIWCDIHLLRILAERKSGSFLALSRRREALSLCLLCPDRAILNLWDTQGFWSGFCSFTLILTMIILPPKISVTLVVGTLGTFEEIEIWKLKTLQIRMDYLPLRVLYRGRIWRQSIRPKTPRRNHEWDHSRSSFKAVFSCWINVTTWKGPN